MTRSFSAIDGEIVQLLRGRTYASAAELNGRLIAGMEQRWEVTTSTDRLHGTSHLVESDRMSQTQSFVTAVLAELGALPQGFTTMGARHLIGALIDMTQARIRSLHTEVQLRTANRSATVPLVEIWLRALDLNQES